MKSAFLAFFAQGLVGLTGLVSVLSVARVATATDFGLFSLAYTALMLASLVTRGFVGTDLFLRSGRHEDVLRAKTAEYSFAMVLITGLLFVPFGVLGYYGLEAQWFIRQMVLCLGIAAPVVCLYEIRRAASISADRQWLVLLTDVIRVVCCIAVFLLGGPLVSREMFFWAWLGATMLPTGVLCVIDRTGFRPVSPLKMYSESSEIQRSAGGVAILSGGVSLGTGALVAALSSAASLAALRGSSSLFGPMNTLIGFVDSYLLARIARLDEVHRRKEWFVWFGGTVVLTLAWTAGLALLSDGAGSFLLGETWRSAQGIVPIMGIEYVCLIGVAFLGLILKVHGRGRALLMNKVVTSLILLCGYLLVSFAAGSSGMMIDAATYAIVSSAAAAVGVVAGCWAVYRGRAFGR